MGYDVPMENFYPRPPRGGRPRALFPLRQGLAISIHALREEGDLEELRESVKKIMISIHALREEGDPVHHRHHSTHRCISIHALREEGDLCEGCPADRDDISIHALREEGDALIAGRVSLAADFYPRPPRGGRRRAPFSRECSRFISIHALREEGDAVMAALAHLLGISIHALREEGDAVPGSRRSGLGNFYPRPPRGGRRVSASSTSTAPQNFYPRPPRGGRRILRDDPAGASQFLSTPSARRATNRLSQPDPCRPISIHALREEGDPPSRRPVQILWIFLSTPSARRATQRRTVMMDMGIISIHALREEGDVITGRYGDMEQISIHALREEGDHPRFYRNAANVSNFYPRPPRGGRLLRICSISMSFAFLSTPSARRATGATALPAIKQDDFYPRPPRGGRPVFRDSSTITKGFLSTPSARRATAKTETKSLFSNKLYNILHEFRRALIYNGSKSYPNHAK